MIVRHTAGKILMTAGTVMVLGLLLPAQQAKAVPVSDLPDLNALTPYSTFGNFYNDDLVTMNGDVGISKSGTLLTPNDSIRRRYVAQREWRNLVRQQMSGATVQSDPLQQSPTVPDASSTLVLMSLGLGCLAAAKRKLIS